ncbi:glycine zipper 2TM domain-containing protein [Pacificimonas sp. ICDLI1SI03]|jgi:hypothetical protein|tara:strand:+ start:3850 stop:4350 length:501 start_codon:yes stop_codon:yes gene_type:complete
MLKSLLIAAVAATSFTAIPAAARDHDDRGRYERHYDKRDFRRGHDSDRRYRNEDRRDRRDYRPARYQNRYDNRYDQRRQPVYYRTAADTRGGWYGRDDRYYDSYDRCRSSNGVNTGTVIGGVVGGVLGNQVAGRGDKTVGTILGAAVGGVLGHEVGKDKDRKRYCY